MNTTERARQLRQSSTEAEKRLWHRLRNRQLADLKFRRQHPIPPYITDFFCESKNLIVELDGGQHNEEADRERTAFLEAEGYRIVRFWNHDVFENMEGVLQMIKDSTSSPHLPADADPALSPGERVSKKRICLGKIAGTHGVKGLVKILGFGDDPMLIFTADTLYTDETGSETIALTYKNPQGKYFLAEIEGVHSKEDAEALHKPELWIDRDQLPPLDDEGEYYIEDLIGLCVVTEDDDDFGVIKAVPDYGAGELLEIRPKSGKAFLLPFTNEYVPHVGEYVTIRGHDMFMDLVNS